MKKSLFTHTAILIAFVFNLFGPLPLARAEGLALPKPGVMVNLSPAYTPALIKGLTIHPDNPFLFDFIVDTGHSNLAGEELKKEGDRLVKYFFTCLTVPEKDLWVNLSPYEKNRMVPEALGQTALGHDLLAQDYILKQLTASLIYPEKDLGREFWDRVYAKAQAMYGHVQIPVNTFNKVWILADKASVYEHGQSAYVVDGHLKVMLEEDYLAIEKNRMPARGHVSEGAVSPSTQIIRELVLPEIEKEVNTGKNFAPLRQIFNSLILATWYKKNLKNAILNQIYSDKSTIKGIDLSDSSGKEEIYQQYLEAYKKGVFNYIKEEPQSNGPAIPRKYFSGGFVGRGLQVDTVDAAMAAQKLENATGQDYAMRVLLNVFTSSVLGTTAILGSPAQALAPQQPDVQASVEQTKGYIVDSLETPQGKITMFGHEHVNSINKSKLLNLILTTNIDGNTEEVEMSKAKLRTAIETFLEENERILKIYAEEAEEIKKMIEEITQEALRDSKTPSIDLYFEGDLSEADFLKDALAKHKILEDRMSKLDEKDQKRIAKLFSAIYGVGPSIAVGNPELLKDVKIHTKDLPFFGNIALWVNAKLRQYGVTDEKVIEELIFPILTEVRDDYQAQTFTERIGHKIAVVGRGHLAGLKKEIESRGKGSAPQTVSALPDDLLDLLNADKIFGRTVTAKDQEEWKANGLRNKFFVEAARKTLSQLHAISERFKDQGFPSFADPQSVQVVFLNDELPNKRSHLSVYDSSAGPVVLMPASFEGLSDESKIIKLLGTMSLAATFNENKQDMPVAQIRGYQSLWQMLLAVYYGTNENSPVLKRYQEKYAALQNILDNMEMIKAAFLKKENLPEFKDLTFYDYEPVPGNINQILVKFIDRKKIEVDGTKPSYHLPLERKEDGQWKVGEVLETTDKAMAGDEWDQFLDTQVGQFAEFSPGGIDLNTVDMGMTVVKDSKGGVQVDFDPSMIKRIQSQGLYSATPIIIQMVPIHSLKSILDEF